MSWRDRYRTASFRGVEFRVDAAGTAHGRRLIVHEYPGKEEPFPEDLGRAPRRFAIEGWVIGADYDLQRDLLIEACEKQGAGELVHPYRGTMRVTCLECNVRENSRDGGMAFFALVFLQSTTAQFPASPSSPPRAASRSADAAVTTTQEQFPHEMDLERQPGFVVEEAATTWQGGLDLMRTLRVANVEGLRELIDDAGEAIVSAIADPITFARDAAITLGSIGPLCAGKLEAVEAYLEMASILPRTLRGTSFGSLAAQRSSNAVTDLIRRLSAAEAVRNAAQGDHESYDAAIALRDRIADMLDVVAQEAGDEAFLALGDLGRALVASVPPPDSDLPRVATYVPRGTIPSLVVSYRLYDTTDREAEIVSRNRLRHPGFCAGGTPLEVLLDAVS